MTHDQTAGTAANTGPACIHDDVMTLRDLAQTIKAHPTQKAAAAAFEAVARIADDLAHRLDAIEAAAAQAKPCEGCGGAGDELRALSASLDELDEKSAPKDRGALRAALEYMGIIKTEGGL